MITGATENSDVDTSESDIDIDSFWNPAAIGKAYDEKMITKATAMALLHKSVEGFIL